MRYSPSVWHRRIVSTIGQTAAAASSTTTFGARFVLTAAAAAPHNNNNNNNDYRSYRPTTTSRLFATSLPTMGINEDNTSTQDQEDDENKYSDYEKWVRRLYMTNMFHPVKMGLTNMMELHKLMGAPMDDVGVTCLRVLDLKNKFFNGRFLPSFLILAHALTFL